MLTFKYNATTAPKVFKGVNKSWRRNDWAFKAKAAKVKKSAPKAKPKKAAKAVAKKTVKAKPPSARKSARKKC